VVALTRPQPTTDYLGIALALLAAGCWASYILLNRVIGRRLPGAEGSAAAAGLSALLYVPVGIVTLLRHPPTAAALGHAAAAGVLASAVPFLADLLTLRRVPARFFGVFMSVNPVLAALVGLVILGQSLGWVEWLLMGADPRTDDARWLLDWIDRTGRGQFSRRDAHRAAPRGRFAKASDLEPALRLLEEHGYLRRVDPEPSQDPRGRGRPASPRFLVNPLPRTAEMTETPKTTAGAVSVDSGVSAARGRSRQ
jgi:EamA-like transporter family